MKWPACLLAKLQKKSLMRYFIISIFLYLVHLCPGTQLYIYLGGPRPLQSWAEHLNDGPNHLTPPPPPPPPPMLGRIWRKGIKYEKKSDSIWILMVHTLITFRLLPPTPPIDLEKLHLCLCLTELVMWICSFLSTSCVDYSMGVLYIVFTIGTLCSCSFLFPLPTCSFCSPTCKNESIIFFLNKPGEPNMCNWWLSLP